MLLTLTLFLLGFYVLIKGANVLVRISSSLAQRLGISSFIIGVLIAGIGTSIPEFAIMFFANIVDKNVIGLGTIIGSNIFNLLFILGLCALCFPLSIKREWVYRDLPWNILAIAFIIALAFDGIVTRFEGFIITILFVLWIIAVARGTRNSHEHDHGTTSLMLFSSALMILGGLLGVLLGSYFVIDGATAIARYFGLSEALIGILFVGIGTSFPELAISFVAALKRQPGIAVGNIIGSNIFDFLGIIGITALVRPVVFSTDLLPDAIIALCSATLIFGLMFIRPKYVLGRWRGLLLILIFLLYFVFIILRG